jgi:hypothetical protein
MQVISAALAFAVTMLVLSMVVSTLVETIHRILGMRERGLYYMLGLLYDHVLAPYRRDPNNPTQPPAPELRTDFQERMSENRTPVALTAPTGTARTSIPLLARDRTGEASILSRLWRALGANWRGRGLSNLTTVAFMERLGAHPLSDRIVLKSQMAGSDVANANTPPNPLDAVLQDIAQKFEAYANEASVFFERRARTLSVAVAFVLAFALHVNAIEIFRTLMRDPALTEAIIARKDEATKAFEAARPEAEKKPAVAPSGAELNAFQQAAKDVEALRKEYAAAIDKLKATEAQLGGLVGWTDEREKAFFPKRERHVCEAAGKRPRQVAAASQCVADETHSVRVSKRLDWRIVVGLLLGGLLVGLGAPFWYDMVNSLSSIRNVARGQPAPASPATPGGAPAGAGGAAPTPQPRTPVDAFKAARAAWIAAGRPAVR